MRNILICANVLSMTQNLFCLFSCEDSMNLYRKTSISLKHTNNINKNSKINCYYWKQLKSNQKNFVPAKFEFEMGENTQVFGSCSMVLNDSMFVFGGHDEKRQISEIQGCGLVRTGGMSWFTILNYFVTIFYWNWIIKKLIL